VGREGKKKAMAIDAKLLEILACPDCKAPVVEAHESLCCTNRECRRRYAISDGIPVMLVEESTVPAPEEWQALVGSAGKR
jgi:uncharacterized protein YbaR (Trm112 family)